MLISPNELRDVKGTQPLCPLFGECGGCAFQDIPYEEELLIKERTVKEELCRWIDVEEKAFEPMIGSPQPYRYRHRIDLKLQKTRNGILIGFTPKEGFGILPVDNCPIAEDSINRLIPAIKQEALGKITAKHRQANLVIRTSQDGRVFWGGIGRKSLRMKEEDYFWAEINGRRIFYSLDTFFQANLSILPKLIQTMRELKIWSKERILFDLYGGVGLFGISLADLVKKVILIEEVGASIELARHNAAYHRYSNMDVIEGRVEDRWPTLIEGQNGQGHIIIIDPPRSGLSPQAKNVLCSSDNVKFILYLSCNPTSLARDLADFLKEGWQLKKVIPFDFFPKTKHIETLALLERQT